VTMPRLKKSDFNFLFKSVKKRIAKAKKSGKNIRFKLTENYLRKQFETQDGLCPCCGIELDLKGRTHTFGVIPDMRATVDRVVPNDGYVRGNVALLHQCCNRFKGQLDGITMYAIAKRIANRFELTYPKVKLEIDTELRSKGGREYIYPRYSVVGSGGRKIAGSTKTTLKPNYSVNDTANSPPVQPES
jgi:hypothetical protein